MAHSLFLLQASAQHEHNQHEHSLSRGLAELPFYPPLTSSNKSNPQRAIILKEALTRGVSSDLAKLRTVYHIPINDAARELGMGVTMLKRLCRKFDIKRWPYRKLASIQKLVQSVELVRT